MGNRWSEARMGDNDTDNAFSVGMNSSHFESILFYNAAADGAEQPR